MQVGSARVVVYTGVIMMIIAVFGKFAALFVMIPKPIWGGVFLSLVGK